MQWATYTQPPGQLGGFAHQECAFGSLYIQTFMRRVYRMGVAAAVIFIDLRAAFHSVVRELILGSSSGNSTDQKILAATLQQEGFTPEDVQSLLRTTSLLPDTLVTRLLREIHSRTWATLHGEAVRTTRGTRPGSPLADAMFHCLMGPIVTKLEATIGARPQQAMMRERCGTIAASIIWADDLAVPVLADSNSALLVEVGQIFCTIEQAFKQRGMTLNMAKGKSEALMTPAGPGAKQARESLRVQPCLKLDTCSLGTGSHTLMLGAQYKHLGTTLSAGGLLGQEIHRRVGQAWSAYRSMARQIFANPALKDTTRLFLLEALIFTKLYYGCGSWPLLRAQDMRRLQVCQGTMLRRTLRQNKFEGNHVLTDVEILVQAQCVPVRVRLAQQRLLLAARLIQHGPQFICDELHKDFAELNDGWRAGLAEDLKWLASAMDLSEWGTTFEDLHPHWRQGRPGWKRLVKQAGIKHVLLLPRLLGRECERGQEEETLLDLLHQVQCRCACGLGFQNKRALRLHRIQKHDWRNAEHGRIHGATCPVCLRHFWTVNRLQLHLRYVSRQGGPNRCGAWVRMYADLEAGREDLPPDQFTALPGTTRRDAVRLVGPQVLGACAQDLQYVEDEFMRLREQLLQAGVSFQIDAESRLALFEAFVRQCEERLSPEAMKCTWQEFPNGEWLGAFFLWCMQRGLRDADLQWWRNTVAEWPLGTLLLRAHDHAVHVHRLRDLRDLQPLRAAYLGPATSGDQLHAGHLVPLPYIWQGGQPVAVTSLSIRKLRHLQ